MKYIIISILMFFSTPVFAHSWYPWECCSDRDCWPMGDDADAKEPEPKIVPGGYLTHDGIFVSEKHVRQSRDGRYHICRHQGNPKNGMITKETGACLFVPSSGS